MKSKLINISFTLLFFPLILSAAEEIDTPLLYAIKQGKSFDDIALLVNSKANVNERGQCRVTPLIEASYQGRREVVKLLLDNNANPNHKNFCLHTSLQRHTAFCLAKTEEIRELLLQYGAEKLPPRDETEPSYELDSANALKQRLQHLLPSNKKTQ